MTDRLKIANGSTCHCTATHSPAAYVPNAHHILPQSWGGQTVASNLITICPNTHTAVHRLIDEYVHAGGDPGWEVQRHYSAFQRDLAARAWAQHPPNPRPTSLPTHLEQQ